MLRQALTKRETAAFFAVSERTIDRWRAEGLLPCFKLHGTVRFDRGKLEKLLTGKPRQRRLEGAGNRDAAETQTWVSQIGVGDIHQQGKEEDDGD
jgi:Helix-turn-helix domain